MEMGKKAKNYLFVCHVNINRSRTAEDVCKQIAKKNDLEIDITAAGMSRFSAKPVTKEMANRADIIFVMEKYMQAELEKEYGQNPAKIVCLNIPDMYERGDLLLVTILQDALSPYLKEGDC